MYCSRPHHALFRLQVDHTSKFAGSKAALRGDAHYASSERTAGRSFGTLESRKGSYRAAPRLRSCRIHLQHRTPATDSRFRDFV